MTGVAVLTVLLVLLPLGAIFAYLIYKGIGSINWAFLTQTPKPVGEPGGGMANAIVGSMEILAIASLLGVPLGIGAGIYLSEYGRNRYGDIVRFVSDVLNGVPSIVSVTSLAGGSGSARRTTGGPWRLPSSKRHTHERHLHPDRSGVEG